MFIYFFEVFSYCNNFIKTQYFCQIEDILVLCIRFFAQLQHIANNNGFRTFKSAEIP